MDEMERESMEFDVVVVGAGPAGLAAAIRLKQLQPDLSVVVLEKGGEVGAHILSGAVVDPVGVDKLLPDWRDDADQSLQDARDRRPFPRAWPGRFRWRVPNIFMPPLMNNHGKLHRLAWQCLPLAGGSRRGARRRKSIRGFAAAEVLYNDEGAVIGVVTGDMGVGTRRLEGPRNFQPGMALMGKYVLIGEGVRGSLAKQLIAKVQPFGRSRAAESSASG